MKSQLKFHVERGEDGGFRFNATGDTSGSLFRGAGARENDDATGPEPMEDPLLDLGGCRVGFDLDGTPFKRNEQTGRDEAEATLSFELLLDQLRRLKA